MDLLVLFRVHWNDENVKEGMLMSFVHRIEHCSMTNLSDHLFEQQVKNAKNFVREEKSFVTSNMSLTVLHSNQTSITFQGQSISLQNLFSILLSVDLLESAHQHSIDSPTICKMTNVIRSNPCGNPRSILQQSPSVSIRQCRLIIREHCQ
jgi:hypothetical protein